MNGNIEKERDVDANIENDRDADGNIKKRGMWMVI